MKLSAVIRPDAMARTKPANLRMVNPGWTVLKIMEAIMNAIKKEADLAPVVELPDGTAIEIHSLDEIIQYYPDGEGGKNSGCKRITPEEFTQKLIDLNNLAGQFNRGGYVFGVKFWQEV